MNMTALYPPTKIYILIFSYGIFVNTHYIICQTCKNAIPIVTPLNVLAFSFTIFDNDT